jgi:hypothetical protein
MARGSCVTLYVLTADGLYHVTRGTWATAWVNLPPQPGRAWHGQDEEHHAGGRMKGKVRMPAPHTIVNRLTVH